MNVPAARGQLEQSFEVHGNVVLGQTNSTECEHQLQGITYLRLSQCLFDYRETATALPAIASASS